MLAPLDISYRLGTPSFTSYFICAQFSRDAGRVSYSAPLSVMSPSLTRTHTDNSSPGSSAASVTRKTSDETLTSASDLRSPQFAEGHVTMPSSAVYPNRTFDENTASDIPSCLSGFPHQNIDALLNDGVTNEKLTDNLCYQELSSSHDLRKLAEQDDKCLEAKDVYEALVVDHTLLGAEYLKQLRQFRHELNIRQTAWDRLATETNAQLLTGLLLGWLEHLKAPLLSVDELSYLVLAAHKPEVVLRKLDEDTRYTIEYLVRFVARLQPLEAQQQRDILRRLIASLTHQAVPIGGTLLPAGRSYRKLREGTLAKCEEFTTNLFRLVYLDTTCPSAGTRGGTKTSCHSANDNVSPPGTIHSPLPDEEKAGVQS
ncbi:uncharacterized protein LOC125177883 [Hyalella azteca]|uniref:Uncharacterized protein LOC125177883 n=1 Tax=Hyalella azteca TaxID=294128 RepID=A0A979FHK1_HYAAZ|nr:uncharacterized protein LOC125177883 [Hyalella azteca]